MLLNGTRSGEATSSQSPQLRGGARTGWSPDGPGEEKTINVSLGDLSFYPGSLSRATGENVTVSEVSRVFRGTDNRQSVLGSWGPCEDMPTRHYHT